MINSTDLKNGVTFLRNEQPYKVVKYSLIKMGRGGATVKLMARNLETGETVPISYSSNVKVDEVNTTKRHLQYLFKDAVNATFMDPLTFEQIEVPQKVVKYELPYVKEGSEVSILFWDEKPLTIDIAPKFTLEVTDTAPGVKGNSATNVFKAAILENGIEVKVPLFISNGDKIVVDTRSGEYVERAKS